MIIKTSTEINNEMDYLIQTEITQNISDYTTTTESGGYVLCEYDINKYNIEYNY